jgi:hypothetical protein
MCRPYIHYVPFWVKDPLDMLDMLKWAKVRIGSNCRLEGNT